MNQQLSEQTYFPAPYVPSTGSPQAVTSLIDFDSSPPKNGPEAHPYYVQQMAKEDMGARPRIDPPRDPPRDSPKAAKDDKIMIFVINKDECTPVAWSTSLPIQDIKEAILCACDAMTNDSFTLSELVDPLKAHNAEEVDGRRLINVEGVEYLRGKPMKFEEFHLLINGGSYLLNTGGDTTDVTITGDRWRRLKQAVEPLKHVETAEAIKRMKIGSNLLKHTRFGFPHLRQFQLSDDCQRLLWYSANKNKQDSTVILKEMKCIILGQGSKTFQQYRLSMLEHLSFSVMYGNDKSLDITCKDEFEYDYWLIGLKALLFHSKSMAISKQDLMSHSKRFNDAVAKKAVDVQLTEMAEEKREGQVGLDDCIDIPIHSVDALTTHLEKLSDRLKRVSSQVDLQLKEISENEKKEELGGSDEEVISDGQAYDRCFREMNDAQDAQTERKRMVDLISQVSALIEQARKDLTHLKTLPSTLSNGQIPAGSAGSKIKTMSNARTKEEEEVFKNRKWLNEVNQKLWKASVDLENIDDMYQRSSQLLSQSLGKKLAEIQRDLGAGIETAVNQMKTGVQDAIEQFRSRGFSALWPETQSGDVAAGSTTSKIL
eukprot:GHVL01003097.1.p1 GENE.GHVL01003097.1~~GHVL01003097.1.p1  ORF type:complete len:615 (-),score=123.33 GHVL01003097.1:801-2597(-)